MVRLERSAVFKGELFRLFLSLFTHFGMKHLLYDLGTFVLFTFVILRDYKKYSLAMVLLNGMIVPLWVFLFERDVAVFCGISSADVSQWVFTLLIMFSSRLLLLKGISLISAGGLVYKLIYEALYNRSIFTADYGFETLVSAHILGALIGLSVFVFFCLHNRRASSSL
jgi:membrane associated rhomboid family serine protease